MQFWGGKPYIHEKRGKGNKQGKREIEEIYDRVYSQELSHRM